MKRHQTHIYYAFLGVVIACTPLHAFAAFNDASFTTSAVFSVNGIEIDVSGSTGVVESATVNSASLIFNLQSGSAITITAPGRNILDLTKSASVASTVTCTNTTSSIAFTASASGVATVTPSVSLCSTTASESTSITSGGGYFISNPSGSGSAATSAIIASTSSNTSVGSSGALIVFTRDLKLGMTHQDVKKLQQFLNARGFIVAKTGVGSPGKETDYFGSATRAAVIKFQEAYKKEILTPAKLTKGTGFFASGTRAFVNKGKF